MQELRDRIIFRTQWRHTGQHKYLTLLRIFLIQFSPLGGSQVNKLFCLDPNSTLLKNDRSVFAGIVHKIYVHTGSKAAADSDYGIGQSKREDCYTMLRVGLCQSYLH